METKSMVIKVRADAKVIINKLNVYRNKEDYKNYKTSVDSLQILIDLNEKNTTREKFIFNGKECLKSFFYYDSDSMKFFKELIFTLKAEISLVSLEMEKLLQVSNMRSYRDLLISFDKLTKIYSITVRHYESTKSDIDKLEQDQMKDIK